MRELRSDLSGVWQVLLAKALQLLDDMEQRTGNAPFWTFGGGTVLMLRYGHRQSKDIDIFFADPQSLGYLNPRNGGLAESLTTEYSDSSDHVKLYFPEGEIDFVASPALTLPGFERAVVESRELRIETAVEIIAKKMWHRGNEAKARDLFDLCVVIEDSPAKLASAGEFMVRHREIFLQQLLARREILETQFNAIDVIGYHRRYDECVELASHFLMALDGPESQLPRSKDRRTNE